MALGWESVFINETRLVCHRVRDSHFMSKDNPPKVPVNPPKKPIDPTSKTTQVLLPAAKRNAQLKARQQLKDTEYQNRLSITRSHYYWGSIDSLMMIER